MLDGLVNSIRKEYRKNTVGTLFMGLVLGFSLLSFLKPGSTDGILEYLGLSLINFFWLAFAGFLIWYVFIRKKKIKLPSLKWLR